jgi:hypothetical protein
MKNYKDYPQFDPTYDLSKAPKNRRGNGLAAKPLMEWEIKDAQKKARSAAEAARLLGVSYNTYKKWAKLYGVFEDLLNPNGYGIKRVNPKTGKMYHLDDVLNGMYPNYPLYKLKRRLIQHGYLAEECSCCGFNEKRITDHKVPLILEFLDGNRQNYTFENLRLICFNCYYLTVGNLTGKKKNVYYQDL